MAITMSFTAPSLGWRKKDNWIRKLNQEYLEGGQYEIFTQFRLSQIHGQYKFFTQFRLPQINGWWLSFLLRGQFMERAQSNTTKVNKKITIYSKRMEI